jgi:hypothetical protein
MEPVYPVVYRQYHMLILYGGALEWVELLIASVVKGVRIHVEAGVRRSYWPSKSITAATKLFWSTGICGYLIKIPSQIDSVIILSGKL